MPQHAEKVWKKIDGEKGLEAGQHLHVYQQTPTRLVLQFVSLLL